MKFSIVSWTRRVARLCAAVSIIAIISAAGPPVRAADDPMASAMDVLKQKGLTKLKPTTATVPWVLDDEAKVHEKLEAVRKAEAMYRQAAKKVKDDSVISARDRDVLSKAQKRFDELKAYAEKPETIPRQFARKFRSQDQMRQALAADMKDAHDKIMLLAPKLNGGMPAALKAEIVNWMTASDNLIVAYLTAEPEFRELNQKYKELAKDAEVATALKTLGKKHRLGSKDFEQDQKAMAAAEATVLSGDVPFYREGMFDYIGGMVNETTPAVFRIDTVNTKSGNWIAAATLAKAGVTIDPSAQSVMLTISGNGAKRTIQCRQVIVPKLRLGKYVLENLSFLAMPDDAKDLGAQLLSKELNGYDVTPDVEKWLFKLVKKEEPKPEQ
jgi:hypothetical protein